MRQYQPFNKLTYQCSFVFHFFPNNVGDPPQCNAWIGQCGLYILVMIIEKIAIAVLVTLDFWHDVRLFILKPVKNPRVEVALVMLIVPFIINVSEVGSNSTTC